MSNFFRGTELRQPMVAVALSFICGLLLFWVLGSSHALGWCGDVWAMLGVGLLLLGVVSLGCLWMGGGTLGTLSLVLLLGFCLCGVRFVVSGDPYEGSSLAYFQSVSGSSHTQTQGADVAGGSVSPRHLHPESWGDRVNMWAYDRLAELGLDQGDMAVVGAVVLGRGRGVPRALRERYSRGGCAHLLAVSGLHLGIVFLFVNLLLIWLNLFWRGHLVRGVLVLAALWGYIAVVGFSSSAVRAGVMFTTLQTALLLGRGGVLSGGLWGAVLLMCVLDVGVVFDVGFLLSVSAVFGIVYLYAPLWRSVSVRWHVPSSFAWLLQGLLLGSVCAAVTAPLVSYLFGYVGFLGALFSPVVCLCVGGVLALSFVWLLLGVDVSWPLEGVLWVQGLCVDFCSGWCVEYRLGGSAAVALWLLLCGALYLHYLLRRPDDWSTFLDP